LLAALNIDSKIDLQAAYLLLISRTLRLFSVKSKLRLDSLNLRNYFESPEIRNEAVF
jgi:hypothetical protein